MDLENITSRLAALDEKALNLAESRHVMFQSTLEGQREYYKNEFLERAVELTARAISGVCSLVSKEYKDFKNRPKIVHETIERPIIIKGRKRKTGYHIIYSDGTIDSPFQIKESYIHMIDKAMEGICQEELPRALFQWMNKNIRYEKITGKYKSANEVLECNGGVCGEQAFLYVALARHLGLEASYASVTEDCYGSNIHHACAAVHQGSRILLVDPAYATYDVKHHEYTIRPDKAILEHFSAWRASA